MARHCDTKTPDPERSHYVIYRNFLEAQELGTLWRYIANSINKKKMQGKSKHCILPAWSLHAHPEAPSPWSPEPHSQKQSLLSRGGTPYVEQLGRSFPQLCWSPLSHCVLPNTCWGWSTQAHALGHAYFPSRSRRLFLSIPLPTCLGGSLICPWIVAMKMVCKWTALYWLHRVSRLAFPGVSFLQLCCPAFGVFLYLPVHHILTLCYEKWLVLASITCQVS